MVEEARASAEDTWSLKSGGVPTEYRGTRE